MRAATAEALLAMKVLSASGERPRDLGDIAAIVRVNHAFDEQAVLRLLSLIETRGYSRGQDLIGKWQQLKLSLKL